MWNQEDALDAGRFLLHQAGWDNKSALERYNTVHDPDLRVGGPYGGRNFAEGGFPRENGYSRGGFHRDLLLEGDRYQMAPPVLGMWPPTRRTTLEEELAIIRGPQRHVKVGFMEGYREIDTYRDVEYREIDRFRDINNFREIDRFHEADNFQEAERFRDYGFERMGRFLSQERDSFDGDDYAYRRTAPRGTKEGSWDQEHTYSRYDEQDSDHEKDKRDHDRRKSRKRDKEKRRSKDTDESPERGRHRERSRSYGHEHRSRRSRSPSQSHGREKRERSREEEDDYEPHVGKKRARDERHHRERPAVAPSATLVVKGLSQRTVEDDLYRALAEWGPLRHVRVIKERNTGVSRGFAFVDFPSVDAAQKMMDGIGEDGLVVDGRRLFFEYSSKPTGGLGGPQVLPTDSGPGSTSGASKGGAAASAVDWMCTVCGCVNFARRTSCFQCNELRTDDAPPADVATSIPASTGKSRSEAGPTHVLVVRGLDEHINEETLHYEFSKYAPIKDLRLVRDKFTHTSRGFAFIHFHSVEEATKALQASNGISLDKNGQPLRVAYAKSIHGPGSSSSNAHGSSSLAATAIEAAAFAQQYDAAGWAPKEYNPDEGKARNEKLKSAPESLNNGTTDGRSTGANAAPQAGFVWDEASGYYFDAASGFYYDGHRGLYYDGNHGIWYSYNQETQQYEPYVEQTGDARITDTAGDDVKKAGLKASDGTVNSKATDGSTKRKAVISAPPATIHVEQDATEKKQSVAKAIEAAAVAAQAVAKKEKEKMKEKEKELRLLAGKKKIGGVLSLWKQRKHEDQAAPSSLSTATPSLIEDKPKDAPTKGSGGVSTVSAAPLTATKKLQGVIHTRQVHGVAPLLDSKYKVVASKSNVGSETGFGVTMPAKKLEGVIHSREGSGRGVQALGQGAGNPFGGDYHPSETMRARQLNGSTISVGEAAGRVAEPVFNLGAPPKLPSMNSSSGVTPFKTDASALGSYGPMAGARRRFTEAPQPVYRDRAAERRNLHGASLPGDV